MNLKEKVNNTLNIKDEIILNIPIISLIGNKDLTIENYKGIVLYSETKIKINTNISVITITGNNLTLSKVLTEKIIITGNILEICYSNN